VTTGAKREQPSIECGTEQENAVTGDFRWQGYTHQELYDALNAGPGASASSNSAARWAALSSTLSEINNDLFSGVASSTDGWAGEAADTARDSITPLAKWADDAHAGADVMRASAETQADYISTARSEMPPPVQSSPANPSGFLGGLLELFGGQVDAEITEAAQHAAAMRAFEVMTTYQANTANNTSTLGQFTAPPQVVGSSAPPVTDGGQSFSIPTPFGVAPSGGGAPAEPSSNRPVVPSQRPIRSARPAPPDSEPARSGFMVEADGLFGDSHAVVLPVLGEP
jgi:PPE family